MKKPQYLKIYETFKDLIREGVYQENQKLPSKRKLSESMKLSQMTIEAGYQQLIDEGYLYSVEKKGYFVAKQVEMTHQEQLPVIAKVRDEQKMSYIYSFETNVVDTKHFPNATWAKLSREVISENHHEMLNVTSPQGLYELRLEIAKYLDLYRGMNVSPNRIVIGSGSTSLINMLVEILGRHKHYAVEAPGFKRIEQLLKANDVVLNFIPVDSEGISVVDLDKKMIDIVHVTPSHQYPTGIVMPISRRIELLNWAIANQTYIIEDDYDSEFRFQGKPIPALHSLDQHDRIIYMNTFTKSLAPSFRVSYLVLPKHLMSAYDQMSSYHGCTVPTFDQYVIYKFMKGGYFERHIHRMRKLYKDKLSIIKQMIEIYPWIKLHGDEAGLHFVMECQLPYNEFELKKRLDEARINISMLETNEYMIFKNPCLILGYSGIATEDIQKAMDYLIHALKD